MCYRPDRSVKLPGDVFYENVSVLAGGPNLVLAKSCGANTYCLTGHEFCSQTTSESVAFLYTIFLVICQTFSCLVDFHM